MAMPAGKKGDQVVGVAGREHRQHSGQSTAAHSNPARHRVSKGAGQQSDHQGRQRHRQNHWQGGSARRRSRRHGNDPTDMPAGTVIAMATGLIG